MNTLIQKLFFKGQKTKTFFITRLAENEIRESVFLKKGEQCTDVSGSHAMICLDPFCVAVWLPSAHSNPNELDTARLLFKNDDKLNACIAISLIEKIATANGNLLLYKIMGVKNHQLNTLKRLVLLGHLLRAKTNTYRSRSVISALYSYPRNIIIVSYRDDNYCNIFPMDIHGYIKEEDLYLLGLRTTNVTLDKILEAKKVVVCDTDRVDIKTVYDLGKQKSTSPMPVDSLPFNVINSEIFGFPVPDFTGAYKEIEIIMHKKMGYHMLMVGKVINQKQVHKDPRSLYHVGFLQYQNSDYTTIDGVF